jgi:hypothetical protein
MKESTFKRHCLVVDEWFINGFNGTKAYKKFYPNASNENATNRFLELVRNSDIKLYKESKTKKASSDLEITLLSQLTRLDVIIDTAEKDSDKINAIKEQNKLLALYKEHNDQQKSEIVTIVNLGIGVKPDK